MLLYYGWTNKNKSYDKQQSVSLFLCGEDFRWRYKYHESIKESDNVGYIYDAVEELLKTKLSKQEKELPFDVQIIRLTERTKDDYDTQLLIAAYLLMTVA